MIGMLSLVLTHALSPVCLILGGSPGCSIEQVFTVVVHYISTLICFPKFRVERGSLRWLAH